MIELPGEVASEAVGARKFFPMMGNRDRLSSPLVGREKVIIRWHEEDEPDARYAFKYDRCSIRSDRARVVRVFSQASRSGRLDGLPDLTRRAGHRAAGGTRCD